MHLLISSDKIYDLIPDVTLVCSIIMAYVFDHNFPIVTIVSFPANMLGWLLIIAGLGLVFFILKKLRSKHTSTDATGVPSEFIQSGLYRFSRNPFYLSYVIIATGASFTLGSLTSFIAPFVCFAVLNVLIIPLEEGKLHLKFGQTYDNYKFSVRRWI